jgi:hypothetical protein
LDVHTFDFATPIFEYLRLTFVQLVREGLGPGRASVELIDARQLPQVDVDLGVPHKAIDRLKIAFLTPTELKDHGLVIREPHFAVLLARARDRISALCSIYQGGSPTIEFRELGERARSVILRCAQLQEVQLDRLSSRSGHRHPLGGFVGEAEYEGNWQSSCPGWNPLNGAASGGLRCGVTGRFQFSCRRAKWTATARNSQE